MEVEKLTALLRQRTPAQWNDLCSALELLRGEVNRTKEALSDELMRAQSNNDYVMARKMLDAQEELAHWLSAVQSVLRGTECGREMVELGYGIDTVVPTFTKPVAFSFRGMRYAAATWKAVFVRVSELLYSECPSTLEAMVDEPRRPGRRRVRMSLNPQELGTPAQIGHSGIWLETRINAAAIRDALLALLERYGISPDNLRIYFPTEETAQRNDR